MKSSRTIWASVLMILICGGLNQGLTKEISLWGAQPDFLIIALTFVGSRAGTSFCIVSGFAAGVIQGAIVGTGTWQFALTRMIYGLMLGWMKEARIERNILVISLTVLVGSFFCGLLNVFLMPNQGIGAAITDTIISAVYNGVIALLVYWPAERLFGASKEFL